MTQLQTGSVFTASLTKATVNGNTWDSNFTLSSLSTTSTSPVGRVSTQTSDQFGKPVATQFASYSPTSYSYDANGRLSQISQGSRSSSIAYNTQGYVDHVTNALNQTVSFTYDGAGRVLTQTLPDTRVVSYSYDFNGNLKSVTTPSSLQHSMGWNDYDFMSSYTPPVLGTTSTNTSYSYNNDKQLTQITRPDGTTVTLNYNSATGLLESVVLPSGQYSYSYAGQNLSWAQSPDAIQILREYVGKLPSKDTWSDATGNIGQAKWLWNNDFNLTNSTLYSKNGDTSSSINFTYDKDGLLTQAGDETITRSATSGLISGTTLGAVSDTLTYDSTYGELSAYTAKYVPSSGPATILLDQSITRDALSRVTNLSDTVNGTTNTYAYTYDSAGRLTDVTKNGSAYSHYNYDSNSNRISGNAGGVALTATYDAQDRLSTYNSKTYTYNLNGERSTTVDSSLPSGAQTTTYTYDSLENLKQVATPTQTISYKFDGLNRRLSKKVGSTVQAQYLYESQYRIGAILDSSGNFAFRFVYGSKPNVPDYMIKAGTSYRILSDPNGSVRLVVETSTGSVAQKVDYDEFGNVISDTSPGFQPFGFAGGLYDPETGLTHFGARDYDASTGRWLQKDPILFDGGDTNLYGYVSNDPINSFDPFGLSRLVFNQATGLLSLFGDNGNLIGSWAAGNNVVRGISSPLRSGETYPFSHYMPHGSESGPNGRYGTYGNFVFYVPGHSGVGVHSGRTNRGGPSHVTNGCIRTTDDATSTIFNTNLSDPLRSLTIVNDPF